MANARALDKRRKSIRNIRKITRTMELIATARYKKAMDRAAAVTAYTDRLSQIVNSLADSGTEVRHPLLEQRENPQAGRLLTLSSNRGLCGGYNASVLRAAVPHIAGMKSDVGNLLVDVSGKRGINGLKFRGIDTNDTYQEFEDQPAYDEVEKIASKCFRQFRGSLKQSAVAIEYVSRIRLTTGWTPHQQAHLTISGCLLGQVIIDHQ